MPMCVQWGQTRGNDFSSKIHVQSISWQGGRKRCLCASSSVRCEETIFPLRFMSNQFPGMEPERDAYVRPVGSDDYLIVFKVVQDGSQNYKCFKWTCQESRRTCHKKFVIVGSGSDIFDGLTFPIGELTPLVKYEVTSCTIT